MSIERTKEWFEKAVPTPTDDNLNIQMACHLEEVAEMLSTMTGIDDSSELDIRLLQERIEAFSTSMKERVITFTINDRKEFFDAILDQVVTGVGVGHMVGLDVPKGLQRVNESNFSKFREDGTPIFDEQGKIMKNPSTYKKVVLDDLI